MLFKCNASVCATLGQLKWNCGRRGRQLDVVIFCMLVCLSVPDNNPKVYIVEWCMFVSVWKLCVDTKRTTFFI